MNNASEENIQSVIQQLNNWNVKNNRSENTWNKQRIMKWVQTRTRNNRLAKEKQEQNNQV